MRADRVTTAIGADGNTAIQAAREGGRESEDSAGRQIEGNGGLLEGERKSTGRDAGTENSRDGADQSEADAGTQDEGSGRQDGPDLEAGRAGA